MMRRDAVAHAGLPAAWSHVRGVLPGTVLAGASVVAAALTVHRFQEGAAIALAGSAVVARVSLRAAFRGPRPARLLFSPAAATTTMAAIVTVLAVHGVG